MDIKYKNKSDKILFALLVIIGLFPLLFSKYYLTLDGPGHIYNGNIIKELILGNHEEFTNLFKINPLPVPNWISHFLFAVFNLIFPDFISEKIVLSFYFVLFPLFFRKIILWFNPNNKVFSYLGVLFAHNHLLYLGSYNLVFALAFLFVAIYFILKRANHFNFREIAGLSFLFIVVYFSHILILLVTFAIALVLPLSALKVEKNENAFVISNQKFFFTKLKLVLVSMLPALFLAVLYILKVDSLEEAGRLDLNQLLSWLTVVRPLITLCMCEPWTIFTRILFGVFVLMAGTNLFLLVKNNSSIKDGKIALSIPTPKFSLMWFIIFFAFTILFLIVPNANILPERLIILVFIFMGFWLATQNYPKWLHVLFFSAFLATHVTFASMHTLSMKKNSAQIAQMNEVTKHIEAGSLLLPFNFAYQHNWLHMHSPGYFGSDKPIAVIENYEGQLQWFPVKWNFEGQYDLEKLDVWAADNKKMIESYYSNPDNPDVFSLPLKDGTSVEIPYAVIFGHVADENDTDYLNIKTVLDSGYTLVFENNLCKLYKMN